MKKKQIQKKFTGLGVVLSSPQPLGDFKLALLAQLTNTPRIVNIVNFVDLSDGRFVVICRRTHTKNLRAYLRDGTVKIPGARVWNMGSMKVDSIVTDLQERLEPLVSEIAPYVDFSEPAPEAPATTEGSDEKRLPNEATMVELDKGNAPAEPAMSLSDR